MTFFIRVLVQRGDTSWENWLGLGAIAAPLSSAFFATLFHVESRLGHYPEKQMNLFAHKYLYLQKGLGV